MSIPQQDLHLIDKLTNNQSQNSVDMDELCIGVNDDEEIHEMGQIRKKNHLVEFYLKSPELFAEYYKNGSRGNSGKKEVESNAFLVINSLDNQEYIFLKLIAKREKQKRKSAYQKQTVSKI